MSQPQKLYNPVIEKLSKDPDVNLCKMMSAPGLKLKDKVFAFFNHDTISFWFGPNFSLNKIGIKTSNHLGPFKNKPPIKS